MSMHPAALKVKLLKTGQCLEVVPLSNWAGLVLWEGHRSKATTLGQGDRQLTCKGKALQLSVSPEPIVNSR